MRRPFLDAERTLGQCAAVVASAVIADQLVVVEQRREEAQRRDQAVGDAGAVDAQHRLALAEHRVAELRIADLHPLIEFDIPFPAEIDGVFGHCRRSARLSVQRLTRSSRIRSIRNGPSCASIAAIAPAISPGCVTRTPGTPIPFASET